MRKTILFLVFAVIAVYSRSFWADYVLWDDNVFIQENALLHLPFWEFLRASFSHYFAGDYLPLTLTSYWLEIQIFGYSATAQHLVNLGLHIGNVLLLWSVLRKLPIPKEATFLMTSLFAIHPMQSEVVLWISERKSLLAIFFALLAMKASARAEQSPKRAVWTGLYGVFYLLSLLSKSTAVFLPALLFLQERLFHRKPLKDLFFKHGVFLGLALGWSLLRVQAYSQGVEGLSEVLFQPDRLLRLPVQVFTAFGFYLRYFLFPYPQSAIYPPYQSSWVLAGSAFGLLVLWIWIAWRRKDPLLWYSMGIVVLFLGPILQIVPRINFVSDRYLYFPMIGFAGLLASALPGVLKKKTFQGLLVSVLAISCWLRTGVWLNNESLWTDTVAKSPQSGIAHNNLGLEYLRLNQADKAFAEFEKAAEVGVRDGTVQLAYHNLGLLFLKPQASEMDLEKAGDYFRKSLRLSPSDSGPTQYDLALVLIRQRRLEDAKMTLLALESQLTRAADQRNQSLLLAVQGLLLKLEKAP